MLFEEGHEDQGRGPFGTNSSSSGARLLGAGAVRHEQEVGYLAEQEQIFGATAVTPTGLLASNGGAHAVGSYSLSEEANRSQNHASSVAGNDDVSVATLPLQSCSAATLPPPGGAPPTSPGMKNALLSASHTSSQSSDGFVSYVGTVAIDPIDPFSVEAPQDVVGAARVIPDILGSPRNRPSPDMVSRSVSQPHDPRQREVCQHAMLPPRGPNVVSEVQAMLGVWGDHHGTTRPVIVSLAGGDSSLSEERSMTEDDPERLREKDPAILLAVRSSPVKVSGGLLAPLSGSSGRRRRGNGMADGGISGSSENKNTKKDAPAAPYNLAPRSKERSGSLTRQTNETNLENVLTRDSLRKMLDAAAETVLSKLMDADEELAGSRGSSQDGARGEFCSSEEGSPLRGIQLRAGFSSSEEGAVSATQMFKGFQNQQHVDDDESSQQHVGRAPYAQHQPPPTRSPGLFHHHSAVPRLLVQHQQVLLPPHQRHGAGPPAPVLEVPAGSGSRI